jgi:hypothetical protein
MGMSTHIVGFKPADDKFKKMLAAWDACVAVGVKPPDEVREFFGTRDRSQVDATGVAVGQHALRGAKKWRDDSREGYEVDLREIDPDVKILRFYNSW